MLPGIVESQHLLSIRQMYEASCKNDQQNSHASDEVTLRRFAKCKCGQRVCRPYELSFVYPYNESAGASVSTNARAPPVEDGDISIPPSALFGDELALCCAFVFKPRHLSGETRECFGQVVHLCCCWLVRANRRRNRRLCEHDCAGRALVPFGRETRAGDYARADQCGCCEGLSLNSSSMWSQ